MDDLLKSKQKLVKQIIDKSLNQLKEYKENVRLLILLKINFLILLLFTFTKKLNSKK